MTPDPALLSVVLRAALGPDAVLVSAEACAPFECDALNTQRLRPDVVALPRSPEQVMAVLRACRRHAVPVVARGAGTGLSGGALPVAGGVLLVLARLDRILDIDPARRLARVETGVTNLEISNAAAPHGLYYAPDPSRPLPPRVGLPFRSSRIVRSPRLREGGPFASGRPAPRLRPANVHSVHLPELRPCPSNRV